jgi:tetratricopeptide (TPR) repeat protein
MLLKRIVTNVIALALTPSFLLCTTQAEAQADVRPPITPERATRELRAIESAAAHHATDDELGKLWARLASDYLAEMDLPRAEQAYNHALKLLRGSVAAQHDYAVALDSLGAFYRLTDQMAESENCLRKALAIFLEEGDRKSVAILHGALAVTLLKEGKYKDAENEASKAIEGFLGQATPDAADLVSAFISRGYARCLQRRCKEGLSDAQQAVDVVQALAQPNLLVAAASWRALAYMEWKTGDVAGADEKMQRALQILSETSDLPYQTLVSARIVALSQYQVFLNETHRKEEARRVGDEIAGLTREQTPVCRNCTVNVEGLSNANALR